MLCELVSNNLFTVSAIGNGYSIAGVALAYVLSSVDRAVEIINTAIQELTVVDHKCIVLGIISAVTLQSYTVGSVERAGGVVADKL